MQAPLGERSRGGRPEGKNGHPLGGFLPLLPAPTPNRWSCPAAAKRPRTLGFSTEVRCPQIAQQPPLDLTDQDVNDAAVAVLDRRGVRVSLVKADWAATQRPGLPDAREWSTALALALIQALLGQRPVAQATL